MARRATIIDVAKKAGVSFKTVSNVLNNKGSMRPSTRLKVEKAIKELGYSVNASARSLRSGTTHLIGLSIFDFSQPFASYLSDQVISCAQKRGYGTIINTYGRGADGETGLASSMRHFTHLAADGWIIFADQPLKNRGQILEQPYPLVLTGDFSSYNIVDSVTMPNTSAAQYATDRLLDAGCTSIALFGAPATPHSENYYLHATQGTKELRIKGYLQAFYSRHLTPNMQMIFPCNLLMAENGIRSVNTMLREKIHPDAIICLNDALALGVLHGLQKQRIRVPTDIQVIGFDNVPESRYSNPSLTTIDPHIRNYAERSINMLIDRIQGLKLSARRYVTKFNLVERGSTCLPKIPSKEAASLSHEPAMRAPIKQ